MQKSILAARLLGILHSYLSFKGKEILGDMDHPDIRTTTKKESSPFTGLEWPRGFPEVKVPRFHDNGTGWW